jgi:hypothetical protein
MNDAATLLNKPTPLRAGDREYLAHRLTFEDQADLQQWIDTQQKDPFEIVQQQIARGNITVEQQKFLMRTALDLATRSRVLLGTYEADALLNTVKGKAEVLYLSIRKGDPEFTREQAEALLRAMDDEAKLRAIEAADVLRGDEEPDPKNSPGADGTNSAPDTAASDSTGGL